MAERIDMHAYARSVGFRDNAERMEQIRKDVAKRDNPAHFERLRAIRDELPLRGPARAERSGPAYAADELRQARIALGIEPPDPPAEAAE
ncbi:MAG TPA: hypothetical protein VNC39_06310 [Acidocella sp.]|jgi:hypothetical protein|uniref:hypothetical protein n=1 Tax=Acidocella sp. TaxID=50710 RepID=UPI002C97B8E5|nr:hypothetical protein [Acidocella sp.]HVE21572.1 hypothetical protein [Acidocella sp.]